MIAHFLKRLLIADVIIFILLIILQFLVVIPNLIAFTWFCLIFFNIISVFIFAIAARGALHNSIHRFIMFISLSFILKFVLCLVAIIAYVLIIKPKGILIVIPFFIFYAIFTGLEVNELLFLLKGFKKKQD